jgi:metabolite-proton symporter
MGGEEAGRRTTARQAATASFLGTTMEWYDFFIYGTASALVFGQLFFPEFDPLVGTLASFATLGVGFVARPFGGIFFGHYGDKIGRKTMLVFTLLLMGIATLTIGLLPTYETIGIWAPTALVVMRLLQGFSAGGEWGGAALMAAEYAPPGRRGFYASWAQMGAPAGLVMSTAIFAIVSRLPEEQFLAWGWRIPFLLSLLVLVIGMVIRLRIAETPVFTEVRQTNTEARMPIVEVFRRHPRNLLLAMGMRVADNGIYYLIAVFTLSYATQQLGLERSTILNGVLVASIVWLFTIPAYGALSDRVGRRPVYMFGAATLALFAFPFFWLFETRNTSLIWLALVLALAAFHAAMYGPQAAYFSELFGTRVRYSGAALGYNLATLIAGGPAPFVATALLAWSGGASWPVAAYFAAMALVTLLSAYLAPDNYRADLHGEQVAEERPAVEGEPVR